MAIWAFNLEEELESMKVTLERLSKENAENDAQINPQMNRSLI